MQNLVSAGREGPVRMTEKIPRHVTVIGWLAVALVLGAAVGSARAAENTSTTMAPDYFVYFLAKDGKEIWRMSADGSGQTRILSERPGGTFKLFAVSELGQIAYGLNRGGPSDELWIVGIDGSGERKLALAPWINSLIWLPGGSEIAYSREGPPETDSLYRIAASGGSETLWVSRNYFASYGLSAFRPTFRLSADRSRVACNVGMSAWGDNTVFTARFDFATGTLSNIRKISDTAIGWSKVATEVELSRDGTTVYYGYRDGTSQKIIRVGFDGSNPQVLRQATSNMDFSGLRLSPDGTRLWFTGPSAISSGQYAVANMATDGTDYREVVTASARLGWDLDIGPAGGSCPAPCDANGDGAINALDLQKLVNVILGRDTCGQ